MFLDGTGNGVDAQAHGVDFGIDCITLLAAYLYPAVDRCFVLASHRHEPIDESYPQVGNQGEGNDVSAFAFVCYARITVAFSIMGVDIIRGVQKSGRTA